jgi:hypothetical protein
MKRNLIDDQMFAFVLGLFLSLFERSLLFEPVFVLKDPYSKLFQGHA